MLEKEPLRMELKTNHWAVSGMETAMGLKSGWCKIMNIKELAVLGEDGSLDQKGMEGLDSLDFFYNFNIYFTKT